MIKRTAALVAFLVAVCTIVPMVGSPMTTQAAAPTMGRVHGSFQPNRGKIFVLAIGNDARAGNPDRSLADAIHIIGINTKTMKGGILNFPRDSWVNIPGRGSAKINEALFRGGPELLAKTLESHTGIRIDYWVMTGFVGFQNIMQDVGGVRMHIPAGHNDTGASGSVLRAGTQHLKAHEVLAYARARKSFSGGDVARTTHQGDILKALLRKLRDESAKDPSVPLRWIASTRRNARFDLGADEMFRLGVLATQVSPKDVGTVTIPVSLGWAGAASVVFVSPGAGSIYKRFRKNASL